TAPLESNQSADLHRLWTGETASRLATPGSPSPPPYPYGHAADGRSATPGGIAPPDQVLESLGPVPERPRLGNGSRGLQSRRGSVGLLSPRPRALARLPLERGRPRRHLRPPSANLLRTGAVERPRPDSEGAPLRPDRHRRQSRRG